MRAITLEDGRVVRKPYIVFRCGYDLEMDEHSLRIAWDPKMPRRPSGLIYRHGFRLTYWRQIRFRIYWRSLWPIRVRWY